MPSSNPAAAELELRRARAQLEDGLRGGTDLHAEELLAACPALAEDDEAALELIYLEFAVREALGQAPTPAQWYERFPRWRADLEQMFQVHDELRLAAAGLPMTEGGGPAGLGDSVHAGDRIGGYLVMGELGRGGMGVVYQARQERLNRIVALKLILAGEYASAKQRTRFQREAEAAARLDHPNIVRVLEVGEHGGRPFCSMEYVDGGSLAERITGAPWPARVAAELVTAIARGAHHAHERGVVHRDLKPANILIAGDLRSTAERSTEPEYSPKSRTQARPAGTPKIADFGLAKSLAGDDAGAGPTRTGDVLGTPAYMAPEQTGGRTAAIGPATDVWAVGVILYELLTGRPPFQGDSTVETMQQVRLDDPVSPRRLRPRLSRDLETICLKCLRKTASDRYPTAAELAEDLDHWLRGEPILARPIGPGGRLVRWCRRNPRVSLLSGALVGLASVAAGLGVAAVANLAEARTQAGKLAANERQGRLKEAENRALDRRRLVRQYLADATRRIQEGDTSGAALFCVAALRSEPDPAAEATHRIRLGTVFRACPRMLHAQTMTRGRPAVGLMSEDGSTVFTVGVGEGFLLWDAATGRSRSATLQQGGIEQWPRLSDDGRILVSLRRDGTAAAWDLSAGGRPVRLPLAPAQGTLPWPFCRNGERWIGWTPDNQGVMVRSVKGSPWTIAPQPGARPVFHDLSPDGRLVVVGFDNGSARLFDAATGATLGPAMDHGRPAAVLRIAFSPDGHRVACGYNDGSARVWDVATRAAVGGRMPHGNGGIFSIAFSPDGRRLLTQGSDFSFRAWDAASGDPLGPPIPQEIPGTAWFNPDGTAIVIVTSDDSSRVWDVVTGRPLSPPLTRAGSRARFRGDRRHLVTLGLWGEARLWELPEPVATRHPGPVMGLAWLDEGRTVLSVAPAPRLWDAATGAVRHELVHPSAATLGAVAPDATRVLVLGHDGDLRQFDARTGQAVGARIRIAADYYPRPVVYAPDGRIATGHADGSIRFWDAETGRPTGTATGQPGDAEWGIQFRPDGRRMFSRGRRSRLRELPSLRTIGSFSSAELARGDATVLSPDGQLVAAVEKSGTLRQYDAETGLPLPRAFEVGEWTDKLTISPDGRRIAAVRPEDHSVRVWDLATGRPAGPALPHPREIYRVAFSPDGRLIASGSLDGPAWVWDIASGVPVAPPQLLPGGATALAFSPRGDRLAVGGPSGLACSWDLAPDPRPLDELEARAQLLAGRRLDDRGDLVPLTRTEEPDLWYRLGPDPAADARSAGILTSDQAPSRRLVLDWSKFHTLGF
jgi:serine/threonine protein kinase/WD40 repeat protein